jgi:hypothetical protein
MPDDVPLRDHLLSIIEANDRRYEQRFADTKEAAALALGGQEKLTQAALVAAQAAVSKAETATEKRFEGVNEFRASLADQAARLMPRAETEIRLTALSDRLGELIVRIERNEGRSTGLSQGWGYLVALVAVIGTVLGVVFALRA